MKIINQVIKINAVLRHVQRQQQSYGIRGSRGLGGSPLSSSLRHFSNNNKALALKDTKQKVISPWIQKPDPKGSQMTYFWNTETNETTALGSPKPNHWVEVQDPAGSELTYWWNVDNNRTTALGVPRPDIYDPTGLAVYNQQARTPFGYAHEQPQTLGQSMKMYFGLGVGMTVAFGLVRAILG